MKRPWLPLVLALAASIHASPSRAFCGFYVARGDAKLFNRASQVVLVRDDARTVITMASDFQGEPSEFAVVIPVPTFVQRGQIHVGDQAWVDHLDAFTAPRLVEYFDENPCLVADRLQQGLMLNAAPRSMAAKEAARTRGLGVKIEARYTVGEYDILILSARQSTGLEIWLRENGYRIPQGASAVLGSYLKQGMRFFVAKVNLKEHARLGFRHLRPIQVAYESPKFMLPIRLGMVNANGPQELFVYALTRKGRVECTNYRTVRLPTDAEIPTFVKEDFARFYKSLFDRQVRKEGMAAVFMEHFWDMSWCDPCAADPLSREELRNLGAFWLDDAAGGSMPQGAPQQVLVTRLHLRYDNAHFPEDLTFQETADRTNFQARFVLRHPWRGPERCPQVRDYRAQLRERHRREAETLAALTGWDREEIRRRMKVDADWSEPEPKWWEEMWKE